MATKLPTFDRLMNPLLRSLRALGGSGSIEEIYDKVVELEKLPDDVLSQLHEEHRILAHGDNHRAGFAALEVLVALDTAVLAGRNVESHDQDLRIDGQGSRQVAALLHTTG